MPSQFSKQLNKQVNTKTQAINERENSIVQGEPTIKVPNYKKTNTKIIQLLKKYTHIKLLLKIIKNKYFKKHNFF